MEENGVKSTRGGTRVELKGKKEKSLYFEVGHVAKTFNSKSDMSNSFIFKI